jgi:hypothetical protein
MSAYILLLPLAVNSKSEGKVDSLPPLGLEPASATFGTLAHLSDCSATFPLNVSVCTLIKSSKIRVFLFLHHALITNAQEIYW